MVSEVNGFLQKGRKEQSLCTFLFGIGLGGRVGKLGLENNQPPTKRKLHVFVERGHMSDPSQRSSLGEEEKIWKTRQKY